MGVSSATFVALLFLPYNFVYWQMGLLLFIQGCGMGMFAAPNTAAIMNSVPPEHRGAASGMRATLQNAGMQLSMAVFFTIVLVGLSSGLTGSVHAALSSAGVPEPYLSQFSNLVGSNPTGALFSAFLGQNPLAAFIPYLPPNLQTQLGPTLLARQFFPNAVAPSFLHGIDLAFGISAVLTALSAVVSLMRGGRYIHELHAENGATQPSPAAPSSPARSARVPTVVGADPDPKADLTNVVPAGPARSR
jgi:MFS family permease